MSTLEAEFKEQILGRYINQTDGEFKLMLFYFYVTTYNITLAISFRSKAEKVFRPWWDTLEDYLLNSLVLLGK